MYLHLTLVPLTTNAPITVTTSPAVIVCESFIVDPDVMVMSAAITGVDKARQTKADVPSKHTLQDFKLIVLTLSIGRMASVLG